MSKLILTRKDLKSGSYNDPIEDISFNSFRHFGAIPTLHQKFYNANTVVFIENDGLSYKILKSRFGERGVYNWVDVLCMQCNNMFKTFDEYEYVPCPRCPCVSRLFYMGDKNKEWCIK